ncbi:MAG: hypothetical protein VX776_03705, partial [Planctomycetota bacterium]|nr:hypothetical protein [Planctomycetota bacterium]
MTISFKCPSCAKPYNVPDQLAGKKSKCGCGHQFVIPTATPKQAPAAAAGQTMPQQPASPSPSPSPAVPTNPLGGGLPTPPPGNSLGGMPPAPPLGGSQLGGLPAGGAFPPAPGGNQLGGMPAGVPGMQAAGWNTPAAPTGKAANQSGGSKKGLWIGISVGAVLLIAGGLFAMIGSGDSVEVADGEAPTTQTNSAST